MTLEERIAKRKAEGWRLLGFRKRYDDARCDDGFLFDESYVRSNTDTPLLRSRSNADPGTFIPVWRRTIKVKRRRTYSFWQACKMAMAGKKMRRAGDDMRVVMDAYCNELRWDNGSSVTITGHNINARWELAE